MNRSNKDELALVGRHYSEEPALSALMNDAGEKAGATRALDFACAVSERARNLLGESGTVFH